MEPETESWEGYTILSPHTHTHILMWSLEHFGHLEQQLCFVHRLSGIWYMGLQWGLNKLNSPLNTTTIMLHLYKPSVIYKNTILQGKYIINTTELHFC